jgi:hypothetical protein
MQRQMKAISINQNYSLSPKTLKEVSDQSQSGKILKLDSHEESSNDDQNFMSCKMRSLNLPKLNNGSFKRNKIDHMFD